MLYKLFSAVGRCAPCRKLVSDLDRDFPEWKEYIDYIDVDNTITEEQMKFAQSIGIRALPTFSDDKEILRGVFTAKKIKELCLTKE